MSQRVIIFGSRRWPWIYYDHVKNRVLQLPIDTVVVHGQCREGADFFADEVARLRGMTIERHPALWRKAGGGIDYGAGPRRNRHMAELGASLAIGFRMPGKSDGTDNMWSECELRGIPVERHGWDWPTRW